MGQLLGKRIKEDPIRELKSVLQTPVFAVGLLTTHPISWSPRTKSLF
jgi:hypothetical protein